MAQVESFLLDHTKVKAPYVRLAGSEEHNGTKISKYDLRFLQPNEAELPTAAVHTLEHLLATNLRDELEGIIDISPMGCRTGFYMILWENYSTEQVRDALKKVLELVVTTSSVPAVSAKECGNYKDHSLFSAQEYAKLVLEKGISSDPFERKI
ncbi:S-ribosylhomocysteine lyase /quorum-sensing autoinducer 2 (AI-2) synthesis protein LuxS [Pilibacter termitis]|uniref:S-ribosylhomocysteine lyase n=1 Tax=Pilibacter termitis TaxID=263852 RepID=A0A1T4MDI8_9ENTE|nr:S-ribosylhomocysteine lyase [Pilibacter termitis]SJZ64926.1 S-ribosylhomocysteine lyase /quorum-sensing autoinducer 2 (AI-2) synthesis protein LuxS [Pilibacter termitis]